MKKEIKAIIPPQRLAKIRSAFRNIKEFPGMTVTRVEGCGHHLAKPSNGLKDELNEYSPKVRIDIVAPDDLVEGILQILVEVGQMGQVGDGIVWVTHVERMIRLSDQIIVFDC
jgi:nitrogen regulatory protein P-II 1